MLQLLHLKKTYHVGDTVTHALDDVTINFRNSEFVAILGPSGSGKTTLLNVIGGLDHYDSGDIIINGKSTKNFSQTDWMLIAIILSALFFKVIILFLTFLLLKM